MRVKGQILGPGKVIGTEIDLEGTIAKVLILTFQTSEEAENYKKDPALKHTLPFYHEGEIDGCHVTLLRKGYDHVRRDSGQEEDELR